MQKRKAPRSGKDLRGERTTTNASDARITQRPARDIRQIFPDLDLARGRLGEDHPLTAELDDELRQASAFAFEEEKSG